MGQGFTVVHNYSRQLKYLTLPQAPLSEQATIVCYLDRAINALGSAIENTRRKIALLGEYRTRLVADVVTGRLDVCEAAAALPEVDPLAAADELGDLPEAGGEPTFDGDDELMAVVG